MTRPTPSLHIRAFAAADIPEVGRLHLKVFPEAPGESFRTPAAYARYLREVLLEGPRDGKDFPSLVCVQDGAIVGFLGIVPLRLTLRGAPVWATCCTQFVVDPARRGIAGLLLLRHQLRGEQDLTFSDECTPEAARIWEWSGASVLALGSMRYVRPLRPGSFALGLLRRRRKLALVAKAAVPLAWIADAVAKRLPDNPFGGAAGGTITADLDADTMVAELPQILATRAIVPDYADPDAAALRWRLARAAGYARRGPLRGAVVLDAAGETLGWYLAYFPEGATGEVLQVVADADDIGTVLGRLFRDAGRAGVVALSGRADPALVQGYSDAHCLFSRRGPLMVVHSRDPALVDAFQRGQAFMSRLEGEWCARFE